MPEKCEALEELRWAPGVPDCDLMMYLRAARSMAAFAGMCDGGSAEDGCIAASRDDTTINALELLHESNYDTGKALQALVKCPIPKGIEKKWADEEQKRFVKGLRQYGKNFFKIRRELLSHKETSDLVEFYYLWKKTPQAATTRPHRRHRRQCVLRRIRATSTTGPAKVTTPAANEFAEMSSASEDEESDDSDSRDINNVNVNVNVNVTNYICNHCCTTTSKDWHHHGKDRVILCTECKGFYKKFGELRPLPDQPTKDQTSQLLIKTNKEDDSIGNGSRRTRRNKTENNAKSNSKSEPSSPERVDSSAFKSDGRQDNDESITNENVQLNDVEQSDKIAKRTREDDVDETSSEPQNKRKKENQEDISSETNSTQDSVSNENNLNIEPDESVNRETENSSPTKALPADQCDNINQSNKHTNESCTEKVITSSPEPIRSSSNVDPPKSPCSQLLVPKQEPLSSPPPTDFATTSSRAPESNHSVPSSQSTVNSPKLRIKEEYERKSPTNITPFRMSSPLRNYPYLSEPTQPLENITNRISPAQIEADMQRERDINKNLMTNRESIYQSSRSPNKERNSPKSTGSPLITSIHGNINIGNLSSSSSFVPPDSSMFQSTYTPSITSSEQRLHAIHHQLPGAGLHSSPNPNLPPHLGLPQVIPPVMPFTSPWAPYSPRVPPHQLGYPFQPPQITSSSHGQSLHSPHHLSSYNKTKSPVTSQSNHISPPSASSSHISKHDHNKYDLHLGQRDGRDREHSQHNEEDEPDPQPVLTRGPSPEPKIEDSECHRSQSAIFLRHWNRGDFNSCARTDLTFKPVPDTPLARKREERARKAAEKEREEQKKLAAEKGLSMEMKSNYGHGGGMEHHISPLGRHTPRNYPDTPALRQLSEYARPHAAFSPVFPNSGSSNLPIGLQSQSHIDQFLQYQMDHVNMMKQRELKEKELEFKQRMIQNATPNPQSVGLFDPHMMELQRRYAAGLNFAGVPPPSILPTTVASGLPNPFGFYSPNERSASESLHTLSSVERMHSERMALAGTDPLLRLQMAGITPELHSHAHNHAHAHQHTHLHVHPTHDAISAAAAAAVAMGIPPNQHPPSQFEPPIHPNHPLLPPSPFPPRPPSIMPRNEIPATNLFRPQQLEEQLVNQLHQEHMQRQLLMERERNLLMGQQFSQLTGPIPSQFLTQHEAEFLRQQQQRERELKLRSLEDAARGGRPPLS